jgi:glycosyltransferase involved in cell wall biosynthesis
LKQFKISVIHPYLETRYNETLIGLYPKHHLWGLDAIKSQQNYITNFIDSQQVSIPSVLEKFLDRYFFSNSPGIKAEIAAWRATKTANLIYSVCGPLSLSRFYPKTKVISWVFRSHANEPKSILDPYYPANLKSNSGFFCLTLNAEKYTTQYAPAKFIPWCVDLDMFDGNPPREKPDKPFFWANGKTGRDYHTLINAAYKTKAEIRIIGPKFQKPNTIPKNVTWIDTSSNPPDQAIDYPTLKEWYAQCSGVCIPLSGDADDTCGYTNMLESMAMRKPVVMTRSGCLHIDPETRNFGLLVEPGDAQGWSDAMNRLLNESNYARQSGENGRRIAEEEFSLERFNRDVVSFINKVIKH